MAVEKKESAKKYTKKEIKAFVADLADKVENSDGAYLHSIIAVNQILRSPGIDGTLDEAMKIQLRDIWTKLKTAGIQLTDPPVLFGLPEGFGDEAKEEVESEEVPELLEDDDFFEELPKASKPVAEEIPDKSQMN